MSILTDALLVSQSQKEQKIQDIFVALAPAGLFGKRASTTSGLTLGLFGGSMVLDGVLTVINDTSIVLTASTTNSIEATRAGVISKSTTGYTPGLIPIGRAVTNTTGITSWTDDRIPWIPTEGIVTKAMADANQTLAAAEVRNVRTIICTGALTAQRNIVIPLFAWHWTVVANTTGFGVQAIGASGTGVAVAVGKTRIVRGDGVNILPVTLDA